MAANDLMEDVGYFHGQRCKNLPADVRLVKQLLNAHAKEINLTPPLDVNNPYCGTRMRQAIEDFQRLVMRKAPPLGRISPVRRGGTTLKVLLRQPGSAAAPAAPVVETWQEIVRYLDRKGIHHWRPQKFQTTGGKHAPDSYHYRGTAVDLDPSPVIFKALEPFAKMGPSWALAELFLDHPGGGFYKDGYKIAFVDKHKDHLHAALEVGKHMPAT